MRSYTKLLGNGLCCHGNCILTVFVTVVTDLKCDYTLSEEYRKQHYLAGLILQELKMALSEPREIRRIAITVLRDQLAKHSFDDRYLSKVGRVV